MRRNSTRKAVTNSARPYEHAPRVAGSGPGLLLVAADSAVGWLLYEAVSPALGLALWTVAALVVFGLFVDVIGRPPRSAERSHGAPVRE